jgi:hypothetical protein
MHFTQMACHAIKLHETHVVLSFRCGFWAIYSSFSYLCSLCIYNSVISALHLGLMLLSSVVNNTTNHALLELNFDWVSVARHCVWNQMVKIYWTFPYDKKVKCPFKIIYIYIFLDEYY